MGLDLDANWIAVGLHMAPVDQQNGEASALQVGSEAAQFAHLGGVVFGWHRIRPFHEHNAACKSGEICSSWPTTSPT